MKDFAFGVVLFPFSWRIGLWCREKKSIFSIGPVRFVLYKEPGRWKPSEALIKRRPSTGNCWCHQRMGNDFYFLPTGQCLRKDGKCDGERAL